MRWPNVDDEIEAAIQRQDGEILIARFTALPTLDVLVPVTVDRFALQQRR